MTRTQYALLALVALLVCAAVPANAAVWKDNVNGTWNNTDNWQAGVVPNGAGHTAHYNSDGSSVTATLDLNVVLGEIRITGGRRSFTVTPQTDQTITFDNNGAGALVSTTNSNQHPAIKINADVILADDLTITASTSQSGDAIIDGDISGTGNIVLNTPSTNNFRGNIAIAEIAAVNSVGSITTTGAGHKEVDGNIGSNVTELIVNAGTTVIRGAVNEHASTMVNGGTLTVASGALLGLGESLSLATGAMLDLTDAGNHATLTSLTLEGVAATMSGTYGSTASGADFTNDTLFDGNGYVTLTVIPEPASLILITLSGACLMRRRR